MDALSPTDRLKMETARSIREDFLHQLAFHEVDTYSSLRKQYLMMKLVLRFYDGSLDALKKGADIENSSRYPQGRASDDSNMSLKRTLRTHIKQSARR